MTTTTQGSTPRRARSSPRVARAGSSQPASAATEVGTEASQRARQVASTAANQGQQVAQSTVRQGRQVLDTSHQQAAEMTRELTEQARGLLAEARAQLYDQAHIQTERLAETLHQLGDQAQALAEGRPDDALTLGDYLAKVAARLDEMGDELEARGPEGLLVELKALARSHPGSFVVGTGVMGFALGRLIRNAANDGGQPPTEESTSALSAATLRRSRGGRPTAERRR